MDFNLKDLPPEKKRVLAIGGIAFVILLFLSFLLSLTEDDSKNQAQADNTQVEQKNNQEHLQLPSSQRYDFEQNQGNNNNQGLENLLNNNANTNVHNPNQEQALGPAPIPSQEEEILLKKEEPKEEVLKKDTTKQYYLHCNEFNTEQDAEQGKAMLAFQGVMATVESHNNKYRLRLGPYKTKDEAQKMFNDLSSNGLLNECRLIGK